MAPRCGGELHLPAHQPRLRLLPGKDTYDYYRHTSILLQYHSSCRGFLMLRMSAHALCVSILMSHALMTAYPVSRLCDHDYAYSIIIADFTC